MNESDPLQLSFGLTLMQIIDVVSAGGDGVARPEYMRRLQSSMPLLMDGTTNLIDVKVYQNIIVIIIIRDHSKLSSLGLITAFAISKLGPLNEDGNS